MMQFEYNVTRSFPPRAIPIDAEHSRRIPSGGYACIYSNVLPNRESLLAIVIVSTRFRSTLSSKFVRVDFKARVKQSDNPSGVDSPTTR